VEFPILLLRRCADGDGETRLMTVGGTGALIELWHLDSGRWKAETLWHRGHLVSLVPHLGGAR
jgi:hypothetical protein